MKNKINNELFFSFEEKNNLFEKKINKLYYWDLLRFEAYYDLLWQKKEKKVTPKRITKNRVKKIKESLFFLKNLLFTKYNYIFFTASRNKINKNLFFDQSLADVINIYIKESILLETFENNPKNWYYNKNTTYNATYIFKKILVRFYKKNNYDEILSIIKGQFKDTSLTNQKINLIVNNFKIDVLIYSFIFKLKKPKIIFITQNGLQKGLFYAAKQYNIPVIEVQHGIIDQGHLSYSYSSKIPYNKNQLYLPKYFFAFSNFWFKDVYFPVKEIIEIGNSHFYKTNYTNKIQENTNNLLVVSSDVFGENLKNTVLNIAPKINALIYFKLHPNQFYEKEYYKNQFINHKNVVLVTNKHSVPDLLEYCKTVLLIQSTALYEALHLKKTAIILKKQSYDRHQNVFKSPNVYLVDSESEVLDAFKNNYVKEINNLYFKNFNQDLFTKFIKSLKL
jgi:hypothetical protein